ncbi:MmyB family transcriptional regulator [Luteipulveratus halotolerans]|uniref:MmyB family transcriptional regulator n=1 Tax=Luteipulveratus halotolerans TaxID=1631356 RepID=UPI000680A844|nr:hypothetical protein [Luteipulveratus halotolerans]
MSGLPASVVSARYDLLAHNDAYERLFPRCRRTDAEGRQRNILWEIFTLQECCNPFVTRADEVGRMVAYLRAAYGKNVDDPEWHAFIDRMCRASDEFTRMWERNDVATPALRIRTVRHPAVGDIDLTMTGLALPAPAGAWVQVFTPSGEQAAGRLRRLLTMPSEQRLAPVDAHVDQHRRERAAAASA